MTRKALIIKSQKKQKFSTREYIRCWGCGRSRGKVSENLCHRCFRRKVYWGELPGWRKSS